MLNLYGIIISLSILVSILLAEKIIGKKDEDTLWGLSFWAILSGIISARIYHVIDYKDYYLTYPVEIIKIWNGGLGIWGALIGGIIGAFFYLRFKKEKILPWLDVLSVVTPLGQAIGRWGNFFNKEIFGTPTSLPWGTYISPDNRPEKYIEYVTFHPLFIYESIMNFILFLILFGLFKKSHGRLPDGTFMTIYLAGYAVVRFFLEFLRINPWSVTIGSGTVLNVSQCISILVLLFSAVFARTVLKK